MNKNVFRLTAILSFITLCMLFTAFVPGQALDSANSNALQETIVPTIIVPTVIIPDTGGDDNSGLIAFFSGWVFWTILALILIVFLLVAWRPPRSTHIHDRHDHHDDI
jgi:4-amino-4-deoxy-L-arabinose transferase-like glycosyltransferase